MIRVLSYCRRLSGKRNNLHHTSTQLSVCEMSATLHQIVRRVQQELFSMEIKALNNGKPLPSSSSIASLTPYLDEQQILRVGGRLEKSELSKSAKHPIILPAKHHLSKLIIQEAHLDTMHGGVELTLAYVRSRYWIINAKKTVRATVRNCVTCIRYRATTTQQLMGQLPKERVTPSRAFVHSGVDYAGPIDIRTTKGRGHKTYKGYIAIFVCLATKAIHIEVVSDMTTNTFLAAFRRFTARRGRVEQMFSDNGTTFVGANKLLRMEIQNIESSEAVQQETVKMGCQWHFIPAASPHFGGLWEAGVKSMKHHMKRLLGNSTCTYEELATLMCQIESCLNSRPLTPIGNDPDEIDILTPGHFLIGQPLVEPPNPIQSDINASTSERWRYINKIKRDFWQVWSREYLCRLQHRYKWNTPVENLKIGTVVLIKDKQIDPARWPLGRIVDVHPGDDNKVRVVTLQTKQKAKLRRAVTNLIPLPTDTEEEEIPKITTTAVQHTLVQKRSVPEPEQTAKIRTRKITNPSIVSVLWQTVLITLMLTSIVRSQVTIQPLQGGVYIEELGSIFPIQGSFKMDMELDIRNVHKTLGGAAALGIKFAKLCAAFEQTTHSIGCSKLQEHLESETRKLEWIFLDDHLQIQPSTRKRRGLLGTVLTSIFGVNDEVYRDIDVLTDNQKKLIQDGNKQSNIMLKTLQNFNETEGKIEEQMKHFHEQVDKAIKDVKNSAAGSSLWMSYQLALNTVHETLEHYGKIRAVAANRASFFDVVAPWEISAAINKTAEHLSPQQYIMRNKLERSTVTTNGTHTIVSGYFPIIGKQPFNLVKLTPIPSNISLSGTYSVLDVSESYMGLNYDGQQYCEIHHDDLEECLRFGNQQYACKLPLLLRIEAKKNCLIEAMFGNMSPCKHVTNTRQMNGIIWKALLTPNTWMFATSVNTTLATICQGKRTNIPLNGTGIIKIPDNCKAHSKQYELTPNIQSQFTVIDSFHLPTFNTSIEHISREEDSKNESSMEFKSTFDQLWHEEVEMQRVEESWKTINHRHTTYSLWVIAIIAVVGIVVSIGYAILSRRKNRKQRKRQNHQTTTELELATL